MVGSLGTGNAMSRGTSGADSTTLVYIPFVQDSAYIVNSVLAVKLEPSDTAFQILYANNYESFGFDTTADNTWNARNIFQFFALFQYDIFGHAKFLIKDERLFNTPTDSFTVTLKERDGVAINSRTTDTYTMTQCMTAEVCPPAPPAPTPSDQPPAEARINSLSNCHYVTTCNTYYWGGATGWTGSGWAPNNGGGSSGSWGTTTSCMNSSTGTPIACTPGWVPDIVPNVALPNQSIIDSLQGYPCAQGILTQLPSINDNANAILKNVFGVDSLVNIIFIADSSLSQNLNAYTQGNSIQFNPTTGSFNVKIRINT